MDRRIARAPDRTGVEAWIERIHARALVDAVPIARLLRSPDHAEADRGPRFDPALQPG